MALTRTSQPNFTINLRLAIFLTVFVINECSQSKFIAVFTTTPKDKEVFVGDTVRFDWDFKDTDDQVKYVKFGVLQGKSLVSVLQKGPSAESIVQYRSSKSKIRTEVVESRRASFKIKDVKMNDTGEYFCTLSPKAITMKTLTDKVHMRVVDLQIDKKASKKVVESWKNQKVSLTCMVRVPKNTKVKFTWKQQPNNKTLSRGNHYDTETESVLKLITSDDEHFTTYTCIAKTDRTTKSHNVFVKRLHVPGPPENLQAQMIFKKGDSYQKIYWSRPKSNGGAKVTGYIIEYKPEGIGWDKATRARVKAEVTEFSDLKLKEGKTYNVRVIARNKVNEGPSSNKVNVKLNDPYGPKKDARSNISRELKITWWLMLINIAVLIKTQLSFERL